MKDELNLKRLKQTMRASGATQLYLKRLAENDNSKNQVYLGPDFTALNVLPTGDLVGDPEKQKPTTLPDGHNIAWSIHRSLQKPRESYFGILRIENQLGVRCGHNGTLG